MVFCSLHLFYPVSHQILTTPAFKYLYNVLSHPPIVMISVTPVPLTSSIAPFQTSCSLHQADFFLNCKSDHKTPSIRIVLFLHHLRVNSKFPMWCKGPFSSDHGPIFPLMYPNTTSAPERVDYLWFPAHSHGSSPPPECTCCFLCPQFSSSFHGLANVCSLFMIQFRQHVLLEAFPGPVGWVKSPLLFVNCMLCAALS